jgi:hypothetical protein
MLILKQNAANTVPTPPAGKGTIFLDDSDTLSVKTSGGNVETFPTVAASNAQVVFMNGTSLSGEAAFTYDFNNNVLNVSGNVAATRVLTDNLLYANGTAWDLQQPGGTNTQVQFNDADSFGGSANFTFNKTTGNANVGNIGATNGVFTNVSGNGSALSAITGANVSGAVAFATTANAVAGANVSGEVGFAAVANSVAGANVSGTVSSATTAGTVTTAAQPNITSVGTLSSLSVTGNANVGNIGATNGVFTNVSGNGSSLSAITGANVTGAVAFATTANAVAGANVSGEVSFAATANAVAGGNVSGQVGNALVAGTVYTAAQPNITSVGTLTSLAVTGNASAGNVSVTGIFSGNGSGLSAIAGANVSGAVAFATTANAVAGANVSGQVGNALVAGTVYTAAQPNITSVGTLNGLTLGANLAMGGYNITGLAAPSNSTDAATKAYVDSVAEGLHTHDSCNAATQTDLATISGGTVTYNNGTAGVGATLTTTGSFTTIDGVTLSNGMRILVKNEANAAHNGIYDRTSSTVLTRSSDFDTSAEMAGGDFTFVTAGTLYDNTGWVMTDAVTTVGTSPVNWTQFSGAGTYTAGTGLTLTGSVFSVNASQTQITSVGTLTSLGVNGTVTAQNFTANTGVFTGNGSGLSAIAGANVTGQVSFAATANAVAGANVSGQVANALVAGTVYTAAQPNITSVGTLTSLAVTGNASAGNISTGGTLSVTGNANVGNIGATNGVFTNVSGNGSALTALNASNISSGTLAQARLANASLTVNGTSISLGGSGTITANTTQVLTLGSYFVEQGGTFNGGSPVTLAVDATDAATASKVVARDANASFAGNVITATTFSGSGASLTTLNASNISSGTLAQARLANASVTLGSTALTLGSTVTTVAGLSSVTSTSFVGALTGAATTAGTVTTAAQPNITSVGTLTSLSVSGQLTNANLTTGANTTAGSLTGNWTLTAGSRLQATYADLAEKYVADASYEAGTVLLFGGDHEVTISNATDSHSVAGVVSTNPAYIMNSGCQGEHVVDLALQGRVPVKVSGHVSKGDLMVSGLNGYAVANNMARAGTIIGKALQNFSGDHGVIEIVVGRV